MSSSPITVNPSRMGNSTITMQVASDREEWSIEVLKAPNQPRQRFPSVGN